MLNWSYVAGFFDGEGNIETMQPTAPRIAIGQAGAIGLLCLNNISSFLRQQGVESRIANFEKPLGLGKKPMHYLRIIGREPCGRLLSSMLPYLQVKKTMAQDTVRFLKLFPPITGELMKMRLREGVRLREQRYRDGTMIRKSGWSTKPNKETTWQSSQL